MFSFFSRSFKAIPSLNFIGVDMHSHLLPGIDDGLQTLEETITYIKELQTLGYEKLILTPHIIADVHPNSPATILPKLNLVREELARQNIKMPIEAAAEYMIDLSLEHAIKRGDKLLTFGKNYILIEMSYAAPSPNMNAVIFELRMMGLQPIFAHPERYNYYHRNFEAYEQMVDNGCKLQANLLSFSGYYGKEVKRTAEKLVNKGMIDFLGTDMHHDRHLKTLQALASNKNFLQLMKKVNIKNRMLL
jgi:protein-tyrosine phosphatase